MNSDYKGSGEVLLKGTSPLKSMVLFLDTFLIILRVYHNYHRILKNLTFFSLPVSGWIFGSLGIFVAETFTPVIPEALDF